MSPRKSSGNRPAEIIAATLELAFEVGPDHVTTGMIATRLGLTQPAIYKHFPNKEDIWAKASDTLHKRIMQNVEFDGPEGQSAMGKLRRLVVGHIDLVAEFPALPEIMVARDPSGTLTDARLRIHAAMARFRAAIASQLEEARRADQLRGGLNVDDGVALLFGVIQSLVLRLIVTRDPRRLLQNGERLIDLQLLLFAGQGDDA